MILLQSPFIPYSALRTLPGDTLRHSILTSFPTLYALFITPGSWWTPGMRQHATAHPGKGAVVLAAQWTVHLLGFAPRAGQRAQGSSASQRLHSVCPRKRMETKEQVSASLNSSSPLPLQGTGGPDLRTLSWAQKEETFLKVPAIILEIGYLFTAESLAKDSLETNQSRDTALRILSSSPTKGSKVANEGPSIRDKIKPLEKPLTFTTAPVPNCPLLNFVNKVIPWDRGGGIDCSWGSVFTCLEVPEAHLPQMALDHGHTQVLEQSIGIPEYRLIEQLY